MSVPSNGAMPDDDYFAGGLDEDGAPASARSASAFLSRVQGDTVASGISRLSPTADEPLRGLTALAAVVTIGAVRFHELAGQAVEYVWQDIAVGGTIVLLASGPSAGKTTLLFQILVARANRGIAVWLLERRVQSAPPGKFIVIIEGEHAESSASRKLIGSC